jgi:hypothetical protein
LARIKFIGLGDPNRVDLDLGPEAFVVPEYPHDSDRLAEQAILAGAIDASANYARHRSGAVTEGQLEQFRTVLATPHVSSANQEDLVDADPVGEVANLHGSEDKAASGRLKIPQSGED